MVVRILIWGLFDSNTTIDELRGAVPELEPPSEWIWNEATDRFGLVVFGDELPPEIARAHELVGREPDVYEEFDVLDL